MSHSEVVPVQFPGGIHNGTLAALRTFGPHGLTLSGHDPAEFDSWEPLMTMHRDPESLVEIAVAHEDPQTARDIATIAKHTVWKGRNLWPGREIPPERFNQGANYLRHAEGVPQEGPNQIQPQQEKAAGTKAPDNDSLTGEMTVTSMQKGSPYPENSEKNAPDHSAPGHHLPKKVNDIYNAIMREHPEYGKEKAMKIAWDRSGEKHETSSFEEKIAKWQVVSLGELQQPGGVGAVNEFNPVIDGPNPDGPDFADNAGNSPEQEVALETWVNTAVDMLNRGAGNEEIIAQLAHDGCPDPEMVLERALAQPEQNPVSDEIGQDPFDAPPVADGQNSQMESVSQQPPVLAAEIPKEHPCVHGHHNCSTREGGPCSDENRSAKRVKIANSSLTGVELERYEDVWGTGIVRVALDDGGTINVSPDAVEEYEGEAPRDPVTDIQTFIDNLPEVEPTRPHIEARIENLELVRSAVRSTISKVGFSDQVKLDSIDADAQDEIMALRESLGAIISESDVTYLSGQQTYRPHGLNIPNVEKPSVQDADFNAKIAEKAAIFVSELPEEMLSDPDAVAYAAARFAHQHNGNLPEFTRLAEKERVIREDYEAETTDEETIDNEGPAEALYL